MIRLPTPIWDLGTTLYLRVNPDFCGMVTAYVIRPKGCLAYLVSWSDGEEREHWDFELSLEKPIDGIGSHREAGDS